MAGVKGRSGAKTKRHWDNIAEYREKIQAAKIIKRLTDHTLGDVEMSSTQVAAGLGLLKKVLPDIAEQTQKGDANNPIQHVHRVIIGSGNQNG